MTKIDVDHFLRIAKASKKLVVVTGAGVSTGSGIPDFASVDSTWEGEVPRSIALSKEFYNRFPEDFWHYYKQLFALKTLNSFAPSNAHLFLKELEEFVEVEIFTQNVDGLHQAAGSSKVVEVHGNAKTLRCTGCAREFFAAEFLDSVVPMCSFCGDRLKPTVVLFGEDSDGYGKLQQAYDESGHSTVALFMGTSLTVSPINLFPRYIIENHNHLTLMYWNDVVTTESKYLFHTYLTTNFSELEALS